MLQRNRNGLSDLEEKAMRAMINNFQEHIRTLGHSDELLLHMGSRRRGILLVRADCGFKESLRGQKFFGTSLPSSNGSFGLGPATMQEGDILIQTEASNVPYVLRRQDWFHQFIDAASIPEGVLDKILDTAQERGVKIEEVEIR